MKIKVLTQDKYLELSFEYNLDSDSPDTIVEEMRSEFRLKDEDMWKIKNEIQMIIERI